MERSDKDMPFLLRYENIAWYQDGKVRILDRREYPSSISYVTCDHHSQVAKAIADMVTQSGGPYTAAAMGMALAAYECKDKVYDEQIKYLHGAADILSHARPTTVSKMEKVVEGCLRAAEKSLKKNSHADDDLFLHALNELENKYQRIDKLGEHLVGLFPQKGSVMTMCFGETIVGMMLRSCRKQHKDMKFICPETRPYFQGSRLTASCIYEMGFDVTVITDNMPAYTLHSKKVDIFTSASDIITQNGYIINKVGTFQIALAAHYYGIPYYVSGTPSNDVKTPDDVIIEERNQDEILQAMGVKTAMQQVKSYYPAFDITPPKFCSGVVTHKGVFSPYNLAAFHFT